jgi:hypothetical protein
MVASNGVPVENGPVNGRSIELTRQEPLPGLFLLRPGFVAKWALLLFFFFFLGILGASWLIRYPKLIAASGRLSGISSGDGMTLAGWTDPRDIRGIDAGQRVVLKVAGSDGRLAVVYGRLHSFTRQGDSSFEARVDVADSAYVRLRQTAGYRDGISTGITFIRDMRLVDHLFYRPGR